MRRAIFQAIRLLFLTCIIIFNYLFQSQPSNGMNPVIVSCQNKEKLASLQLAVEYALLLNLPYNSVSKVNFQSVVTIKSQ